jgi:ABC-type branched-subunit amino acid transport system ATPase component
LTLRTRRAVAAVAALGAVEALQGYGVSLFTPEIAATLGVGAVSIVSARILAMMLAASLPLVVPKIRAFHRAAVQAWVFRVAAVTSIGAIALTGRVGSTRELVAVLCLTSLVTAPAHGMRRAVMATGADPASIVRLLSLLQGAVAVAQLGLALAVVSGGVDDWDTTFEATAAVCCAVALVAAVLLPFREERAADPQPAEDGFSWREVSRSWRATPSLVGIAVAVLALGLLLMPYDAVLSIYLHAHWQFSTRGTAVVFTAIAGCSLAAVVITAGRAGRRLVEAPGRGASEAWCVMAVAALLLAAAPIVPSRPLMVVAVSLGSAAVAALIPVFGALAFAVTSPQQRACLSAAFAAAIWAGSLLGIVVATSFANRHGARAALLALAALGLLAAAWWRSASPAVATDREAVRDAAIERREYAELLGAGGHLPLLECRGISFSYGRLQVLFDVDFTVETGEVVALLGTNGAGKSTLLKVISGIGLPQRGSLRLAGRDITYLDAEDRVGAGIAQVPGGHAVFGSMNVIENLQAFGYTLGRDKRTVDDAISRCLDVFPRLAARRTATAATLSGGEQQMLGLCRALILKPRLLLIDELTMGLAPSLIAPLLDLVRRINLDGTAVVVVEQSVNIALSLVDHAYFMEKGSVRFDGRAGDLLERQDLLRAVFLQGVAKGALR